MNDVKTIPCLLFFLMLVVTISVMPLSFAEFPTPVKQIKNGITPEDIQCNENRVLVVRNNGAYVCVTEKTALKAGWEIIFIKTSIVGIVKESTQQLEETIDYIIVSKTDNEKFVTSTNDTASILSDKIISKTNIGIVNNMIYEFGDPHFWPQYTLSFPEQVRVGEQFDIVLDYQFIIPSIDDDEFGVEFEDYSEPEKICSYAHCAERDIVVGFISNVDLINRPDYVFYNAGIDTKFFPHRSSKVGHVHPPYNNTAPQQETFTFVINKPTIDYNYGEIEVGYTRSGNERIYFYVGPESIVHLSKDPVYMSGEGPSQLVEIHKSVPINATNTTFSDPPDEIIPDLWY